MLLKMLYYDRTKEYDFISKGYDEQGDYYSTGSLHEKEGVRLSISKDYGVIEIINVSPEYNVRKKDVFKNLKNQLEPFFKGKIQPNINRFILKYTDSVVYEFIISHNQTFDMIWIKRAQ